MPQPHIAIAGINTPLGRQLILTLAPLAPKIIPIRDSDLRIPPPALAEKINNAHTIINLHGQPTVSRWHGRKEFDIYCQHLLAIRSIVTALRFTTTKPNTLLTLSNAMTYDPYDVHDEYSAAYGDNLMAEIAQMETTEALKTKRHAPNTRLIIARTGYIMSRDHGPYPLWAALSRIGWGGRVAEGYQCIPMILDTDATRAILHLLQTPTAEGIYNLTIPNMASMNELVTAFANTLSRHQHRLPRPILQFMAGRSARLLEQNCKVLPRRLLDTNFQFQAPTINDIIRTLQTR